MRQVTVYLPNGSIVYVTGADGVNVTELGVLTVRTLSYAEIGRFAAGFWAGYTIDAPVNPAPVLPPVLPAPPPSKDDDVSF